jgi:hypothetical protein
LGWTKKQKKFGNGYFKKLRRKFSRRNIHTEEIKVWLLFLYFYIGIEWKNLQEEFKRKNTIKNKIKIKPKLGCKEKIKVIFFHRL